MRMLNHTKQAVAPTLVLAQNHIYRYQESRGRWKGFPTPPGELLRGVERIKWILILLLVLTKPLAGQDKALHVSAGVVLTWGSATAFRNPTIGLALGVTAGIAKEVVDSWGRGNRFDKSDFLATFTGSVLTYVAIRLALASEEDEEEIAPNAVARDYDGFAVDPEFFTATRVPMPHDRGDPHRSSASLSRPGLKARAKRH